jgi:hypothetical protein
MNTAERHARYDHLLQRAVETRLATLSRRSLLRTTAIGGAAIAFGGTGLRAMAQDSTPMADAAPFGGPIDVLNYALTLEHLEAAFYRDGLAAIGEQGITSLGFDPGVFDYLGEIGAHEAAHVTTLTDVVTQLGGTPVAEQTYDFGYSDAVGFLQVAQALEDTGVAAYQGAAQYLMENDDLLTAALTIHGVEARHASYVAILNGQNPYPEAVNPTLTPGEVLEIATPFIQM